MTQKSPTSSGDGPGRKPYERPRLDVYGDIREIAKSIGMDGMTDGGTHANTKTQ